MNKKYGPDNVNTGEEIFFPHDKYKFDKFITGKENFPKLIRAMVKDKKGFIWFGTDVGLYRFDGSNFKVYLQEGNDQNSINSNKVNSICDDDNNLWIGTFNGLSRFDKTTEKFKVFRFNHYEGMVLESSSRCTVYISRNGELWIGTEHGLNKFNKVTEEFNRCNSNPEDSSKEMEHHSIFNICEDEDNNIWMGTNGLGLVRYDLKNNLFKQFRLNHDDLFSISSNYINDIIVDIQKNIWVATCGGGVNKFDKEKEIFYRYQHDSSDTNSLIGNEIISMAIDTEGMLWFGCKEGISIFDPLNNNFINLYKYNNPSTLTNISCLYSDNTGIVWVCLSGEGGFSVYNKSKWKFNHYTNIPRDSNSISSNLIKSICDDANGNVWIGNDHTGIDVLNKKTGKFSHLVNNPKDSSSLSRNFISHIYKDKKNFMWVATDGGPLEKYDPETNGFVHYFDFDGKVFYSPCIFEDKKENLWLGLGNGGIRVFDKNRVLKKKYTSAENGFTELNNVQIYKIYEDRNEQIWIATDCGLAMLDPRTEEIIFYKNIPDDTNSLSYNSVGDTIQDNNGFLWITTMAGLDRFDTEKKSFKHYTEENGLANNTVFGILRDEKERIWLSIYKGITLFDPEKETFINYDLNDGVQGSRFFGKSSYVAEDGKMYFGGENGFNSFYPDSISQNKNAPVIVLTNFRIFDQEITLTKSITETKEINISYAESTFSFDFAALDYTNPAKNKYAYMLEGVDKNWNYVGNTRTADYKNIDPGNYKFKVKASNNNGVWNEEGISMKLIITPPWNETSWFKGLTLLSIAGGIGLMFRKRFEKINKEKKQQEEFTKKLIESQEIDRKRIAAELHDSLGQDLAIIKNKALISIKKGDDSKLKEHMKEISELTTSAINEVREISYNLRPYELDRLGLLKTIQALIDRAGKSTNIKFNCDIDNIDQIFTPETEINLFRIIQECLTNIIKHSGATEVTIHLKKFQKNVSIFISDNGLGFDVDKKFSDTERKGFGLKGIPERVKLFGGEFRIESEERKGTRIKISIPF